MSRSLRRAASVGMLTAGTVLLAGCSALQGLAGGVEPERDASTGEVVEAVEADPFALRVGDCLNVTGTVPESEEAQEVASVPTVPCGEEHDGEVYAAHQLDEGEYPGDAEAAAAADELCYAGFEAFVGMAYEDSTLDFTTFYPTAESWQVAEDREVLCVVVDPAAGVTGTLEGAAY